MHQSGGADSRRSRFSMDMPFFLCMALTGFSNMFVNINASKITASWFEQEKLGILMGIFAFCGQLPGAFATACKRCQKYYECLFKLFSVYVCRACVCDRSMHLFIQSFDESDHTAGRIDGKKY